MSHYPDEFVQTKTVTDNAPYKGAMRSDGARWNGQRWVSQAEWEIAMRIREFADRTEAYYKLPWYVRIFHKRPR